jgi:hypothetical protein
MEMEVWNAGTGNLIKPESAFARSEKNRMELWI